MAKFTCVGSVRGCCDRIHGTKDAAMRCTENDRKACRAHGAPSDRRVIEGRSYTSSELRSMPDRVVDALRQST